MSTASPSSSASATHSVADDREPPQGRLPRRRLVAAVVVLVVVAAVAVVAAADLFGGSSRPAGGVADNAYPTSFANVTRGSLASVQEQNGTLGYATSSTGSSLAVVNQATGTFTWLPPVGRVLGRGAVLYRVSNQPVVLLYGEVPAYRSLSEGLTGPDVRELNANLVALGYATRGVLDPSSNYFSSETAYALELLQKKLGLEETGSLALGEAVFAPGSVRITSVTATLGTAAPPGGPVMHSTSTRRQVVVNLDAAEHASVRPGDRVLITLPNNQTTPGVVTSVGMVASSGGSGSTIPVHIAPSDPKVTGTLDQTPVQVQITTASVKDALIAPVDALLALAGGGYALETVDSAGVHRLVAVTLGLFDDADGLVQVSGSGLASGQRIVVPTV